MKDNNRQLPDTLENQRQNYDLGKINSNKAMQQLYKNQLDNIISQKNKQKLIEREREHIEKKQFNQRLQQNKQTQKMKQISYKNYYNMLLNNQQHHQDAYVSPYSKRDVMKDQHIIHGVQDQKKKIQVWEIQQRKRQAEKKNSYRQELLGQIQQKKRKEIQNRDNESKKQEQYRKYSKLPQELSKFQRERKREDMQRYKEDLDRVKNQKQTMKNSKTNPNNIKYSDQRHNALTNPLPYNIQNPYILKEMITQQQYTNSPQITSQQHHKFQK